MTSLGSGAMKHSMSTPNATPQNRCNVAAIAQWQAQIISLLSWTGLCLLAHAWHCIHLGVLHVLNSNTVQHCLVQCLDNVDMLLLAQPLASNVTFGQIASPLPPSLSPLPSDVALSIQALRGRNCLSLHICKAPGTTRSQGQLR